MRSYIIKHTARNILQILCKNSQFITGAGRAGEAYCVYINPDWRFWRAFLQGFLWYSKLGLSSRDWDMHKIPHYFLWLAHLYCGEAGILATTCKLFLCGSCTKTAAFFVLEWRSSSIFVMFWTSDDDAGIIRSVMMKQEYVCHVLMSLQE